MYSQLHSLAQSRRDLNFPQQDAESSHTPDYRVGVVSALAGTALTNDVNADGYPVLVDDLADKQVFEQAAIAGMFMTEPRADLAGSANSIVRQKHDSSYSQFHKLPAHHQHSLSYDDDSDDYDDAMSDTDGGAPLHAVATSTAEFEYNDLPRGAFPLGTAPTNETEEENDDSGDDHSMLSEVDDDFNPDSLGGDETPAPYVANTFAHIAMDAPPHLQSAFSSTFMMGTEFQAAGWGEDFWPAAFGVTPFDDDFDVLPPVLLSNPNPLIPGSENLGLVDFLRNWAYQGGYTHTPRSRPPDLRQVVKQASAGVKEVTYNHLDGDRCDFQGLDWIAMETTREAARARRQRTYKNYVNHSGSDELTVSIQLLISHFIYSSYA